jgi:transcriptional regulator with GAF, ATPase, and Fis domain
MTHKDEVLEFERKKLRKAIVAAKGSIGDAAKELDMAASTLNSKLNRHHPELQEYARKLREKNIGHRGRGRPRFTDANRTKKAVAKAWKESGGVYAECARLLGLAQSTVKQLVERYGLNPTDG